MLKFFGGGATFIQGATSIPDSEYVIGIQSGKESQTFLVCLFFHQSFFSSFKSYCNTLDKTSIIVP